MKIRPLWLALPALVVLGCATQRPVLYPNEHLARVGPEAARYDVDRCIEFARQYAGRGSKSAEAAEEAAKGAVRGGVVGGAAGAVWGQAGRGAGSAAAGAAAGSLMRSLFQSRQLDPVERRFVVTCLSELGYQPVGWR